MSLQAGMADALRALGSGFNLPEVAALYAPLLAAQPREGVQLQADLAYGSHPRQRLDVYAPSAPGPHPVLVWFPGGGFIRGSRAQRANIGWWGARAGFVTVLADYRLAPECRWPSGPEDVVAVWQWLQFDAARWGGDAQRIVLAGESAGAAHVAAATLMRRFQPAAWQIAGAVLLSGPYNAQLEGLAPAALGISQPDPRNRAYFGPEPATWAEASIATHIDVARFPLWLGFAERDLLQMQVQAGELFARLVGEHGFAPTLCRLAEHNHFSGGFSVGTDDSSLSGPLQAFVAGCTGTERAGAA
ncbi:MAG: hypothetical protein RJA98_1247 [Pseudomonadota bacterium]|jgi:acetyl esterase/lipase